MAKAYERDIDGNVSYHEYPFVDQLFNLDAYYIPKWAKDSSWIGFGLRYHQVRFLAEVRPKDNAAIYHTPVTAHYIGPGAGSRFQLVDREHFIVGGRFDFTLVALGWLKWEDNTKFDLSLPRYTLDAYLGTGVGPIWLRVGGVADGAFVVHSLDPDPSKEGKNPFLYLEAYANVMAKF